MAPTPYAGTLRCRKLKDGKPASYRFTASDVAGELVTFDDLGDRTAIVVPSGGLEVVDLTLKGAGVDTDTLRVRKGTSDGSIFLDHALLANTTTDRATRLQDLLGARLEPGEEYGFVQVA